MSFHPSLAMLSNASALLLIPWICLKIESIPPILLSFLILLISKDDMNLITKIYLIHAKHGARLLLENYLLAT